MISSDKEILTDISDQLQAINTRTARHSNTLVVIQQGMTELDRKITGLDARIEALQDTIIYGLGIAIVLAGVMAVIFRKKDTPAPPIVINTYNPEREKPD